MDEGGCCLVVVLGVIAIVAGGAYYVYDDFKDTAQEEREAQERHRQEQFAECMKPREKLEQDQPGLDARLQDCIDLCRSDNYWAAMGDKSDRTNKRRSLLCSLTASRLLHFRAQSYLTTNPREVFKVGCKFAGALPSDCDQRFESFSAGFPRTVPSGGNLSVQDDCRFMRQTGVLTVHSPITIDKDPLGQQGTPTKLLLYVQCRRWKCSVTTVDYTGGSVPRLGTEGWDGKLSEANDGRLMIAEAHPLFGHKRVVVDLNEERVQYNTSFQAGDDAIEQRGDGPCSVGVDR